MTPDKTPSDARLQSAYDSVPAHGNQQDVHIAGLRAVLAKWGQPAQADEYPALVCDYCGALTPDPWHSSGMLHGKMSKHIHSCDACCRGAAQAAPQQEAQEPAAVVVPCHTPSGKRVVLYSAKQDLPIGTQLYTSPQPSPAAQEGKSHDQ